MSYILLVEDDEMNRMVIEDMVEFDDLAAELVCVGCGEDAVAQVTKSLPLLILMDVGLPGIDGYEVARRIRANDRCNHTRLIALTGFGQESDVKFALSVGFDSHLVKPVDLESLTELMERFSMP